MMYVCLIKMLTDAHPSGKKFIIFNSQGTDKNQRSLNVCYEFGFNLLSPFQGSLIDRGSLTGSKVN